MRDNTVVPFPPRPRAVPAPAAQPSTDTTPDPDVVALQLVAVARTLCLEDGALADEAVRRAAEVVARKAAG